MKNFQIIVIVIFLALAVFGVLVFSGAIKIGKDSSSGPKSTVVLWGTIDNATMVQLLDGFNGASGNNFTVKYEQKNTETFEQDLLEALASGVGPDLFFITNDLAFHYANKIVTIPFESYPLATYQNNFAGAGDVFVTSQGILAFPLAIDPLVMYFNRSILDSSGVIYPPATWDDLVSLIPKLTIKDDANKISRSAIALGQFSNVAHAKDILSALFLQTGNKIVKEQGGKFVSALNDGSFNPKYSLVSMLKFYTDFTNPVQSVYSWNRSFINSTDAFSRGDTAFYIGYASELIPLTEKNPNQNFGVAPLPQIAGSSFKVTGGHVLGISILSASQNSTAAFTVAGLLSGKDFASRFTSAVGMIPARRDLLNTKPTDAYSPIFYDSALYAKSWLDPSVTSTDGIFRDMIGGVLSNSESIGSLLPIASGNLDLLLLK